MLLTDMVTRCSESDDQGLVASGRFEATRLVQPSLSIWFFLHKKKVGNFGEKPFVWEFLLGGDTSKKRIKIFTRKNHHGGSPAPPRVPDLVCKISFVFPRLVFADGHFISFG
jgi:hypothetical protein